MKPYVSIAAVALVSGLLNIEAQAQDASERILACQVIEDSVEKLACFEAAAALMSSEMEQQEQVVKSPAPEIASPAIAPTATAKVTPPAETTTQSAVLAASQSAEEVTPEAPAAPARRRILPSWIPTVSFGRRDNGEQVEEPDEFEISVTRIQRNNFGRHFFTTADGHVWRQIRIDDIRAPKSLPAQAKLRRTFTGSIRLEIDDNGRSYPVNRIE